MTRANLQLTDHAALGRPDVAVLERVVAPLSALLTQELDGAAGALGLPNGEILVAALGRAIERTIGRGSVAVDVAGNGIGVQTMTLACAAPEQIPADEMLAGVHHAWEALASEPMAPGAPVGPRAQLLFANGAAAAARAHLGHVLELRAYRDGDVIALDWWFDTRSFEAYTVQELAEQFPLALIELTSEATPGIPATHELAMAH
jgi:hypothetical protein